MGLLLSLLLKPFMALVYLTTPYALTYGLWHVLPDSRIKRFLFKSYGDDNFSPWIKAARARSRASAQRPVLRLLPDSSAPRDSRSGE